MLKVFSGYWSDNLGKKMPFVFWGYFISAVSGTALGTFHTCISLAVLPAGIIAGILWNFNFDFTFIYGTALGILSILFLARVNPEEI